MESLVAPSPPPLPVRAIQSRADRPRRWSLIDLLSRTVDAGIGLVTLVIGLAAISAIPLLNLLSLGYLLEASRRVAETGSLFRGFPGLHKAASVGKILIGAWLWWLPVRIVHGFWRDAELISPGSQTSTGLRLLLVVLTLAIGAHVAWACLRGGKLLHFLWPAPGRFLRWIGEPGAWRDPSLRAARFVTGLRLTHYARLGVLGFAGALVWLAPPVAILMAASSLANPGASALLSLVGGILLGVAALFVPFLQTRFAVTRRFSDFFDPVSGVVAFWKAPVAFWIALSAVLLFAIPLYLLKIELTPRELAWLPNLFFVISIFPARLLAGWAVGRSMRAHESGFRFTRLAGTLFASLSALPVVAIYVFFVWLSQYLSWHGVLGLWEQHAFLVPAPLFGL